MAVLCEDGMSFVLSVVTGTLTHVSAVPSSTNEVHDPGRWIAMIAVCIRHDSC
jgi:hypothetical protein